MKKKIKILFSIAVAFAICGFLFIEDSVADMNLPDNTICLTLPTGATKHCVAREDGKGDLCSSTAEFGPLCYATGAPVK